MKDKLTGHPRGFGFVTFESEESVDLVLSESNHEIFGKKVEVKVAEPKKQKYDGGFKMNTGQQPQPPTSPFMYQPPYFGIYPGLSFLPPFVPPMVQQYNDLYEQQLMYSNMKSPRQPPFYYPVSPKNDQRETYINNESRINNYSNESRINNDEDESKNTRSKIVGGHRYPKNGTTSREIQQRSNIETIDETSLFMDSNPKNKIINDNIPTERKSWSGFDSFIVDHNEAEETIHRHSWSGW